MKRVGDPCRPSANPLSFIRSFFPLFRPSVLSPTPFPALIHEDSVLYNLILQSRAVLKAADFTSRLDMHIYTLACTQRHAEDESMSTSRAISVIRLMVSYPNGKFPSRTKKPTRSRAARLPTSCRTCTLKSARNHRANISNVYKFERVHRVIILRNSQRSEDRLIEKKKIFFFITVHKFDKDPPDCTGSFEYRSNEAKTSFNRYPRHRTISEVSLAGDIEPRQRISRALSEFSTEHTFQSGVTWREYGIGGRERRRWRSPCI